MHKSSRVIFLLAVLGVILLASIPVYIILKGSYSQRMESFVGQVGNRQNNLQHIERVITLLNAAENNFRIYTLTGEKPRAALYSRELMEVSDLLVKITTHDNKDSNLDGMLAQKKAEMRLVLQASVYSDSLWEQALYLQSNPDDFRFYSPGKLPVALGDDSRSRDSSIVESYLVYQRQHKGLLGRLKDAILDDAGPHADSIRKIKMVGVQEGRQRNAPRGRDLDTTQISVNLWSQVLNQLNSARGGLQAKTLSLLRSNEVLFNQLKLIMASVRQREFQMIESRDQAIAVHAQDLLKEFKGKKILMASFIIILALIILCFIWQFYKNGEVLLDAKRKAENFAHLKTTFAATVSHEVRGLTHAINASVEALNDKQPFSRRKELIQNMQQSWETLLVMLNNILDYTRMEQHGNAPAQAPFSPGKVVLAAMNTMKTRAETKSLKMETMLALPDGLTVLGNEGQFSQVLINLLGNAIKFTASGSISVRVLSEEKSPEEILLTVVVKDTGRGMEKKHLAIIFNEFQQIDSEKDEQVPHGSGLGLAIVKKIVQQHGGKIEVKSEPGKGSAFTFRIPYKIVGSPKQLPTPKAGAQDVPPGLRVLMVENDLLHRKYVHMLLTKAHVKTMEASAGKEALELLATHEPDVVLTDINMPEMNGFELALQIRNHPSIQNRSIPIVALTGTISEEDIQRFREVGINDYLVKPFTPKDLLRKLSEVTASVGE